MDMIKNVGLNSAAQETNAQVPTNTSLSAAVQKPTAPAPADTETPLETTFVEKKEQTPAVDSSSEKNDEKKQEEQKKTKKHRHVEHCKLVHEDDCIIITKDFAKRANDPSSPEFKKLAMLRREFPTYSVVARTAESSSTRPSMKGLTAEFMERHIRLLHSADMAEYNKQKKISEAFKCPHMYMRNWFDKKYPDWRENKVRESA